MKPADQFRSILAQPGMIVAPGAYDCVTAKLIEQAGFSAVYMTGAGTAASLGYPDYGLITMSEMVENAGRIARAVDLPVIADADTGYGNELNVYRTVLEYEKTGVAGIHLEDQEFPKRCGHLDGKRIIPLEDYVSKIRAAVEARQTPEFFIIARTDARSVVGLKEAVTRANAALEAGADMAFVESPATIEEVEAIPRMVNGPCLLNLVYGGKTPIIPLGRAEELGYKLAILPGLLLQTVVDGCDQVLGDTKLTGSMPPPAKDVPLHQIFRRFGADEWDARRDRFCKNAASPVAC